MKKSLLIVTLLITGATPTFANAAWWNPLSWFKNDPEQNTIQNQNLAPISIENTSSAGTDSFLATTTEDSLASTDRGSKSKQVSTPSVQEVELLRSNLELLQTNIEEQNKKIIESLTVLEKRVQSLEEAKTASEISGLNERITSLEQKPTTQNDDQSMRIKKIIERLNILMHAGYIVTRPDYNQYWVPITCEPGESIQEDKLGEVFGFPNKRSCEDTFQDLVY